MPRTKLDKSAKREPVKELFLGRMAVMGITKAGAGTMLGWSESTAKRRFRQPIEEWKLNEIYALAFRLRISRDEVREKL